jgi:hypothetical protein
MGAVFLNKFPFFSLIALHRRAPRKSSASLRKSHLPPAKFQIDPHRPPHGLPEPA